MAIQNLPKTSEFFIDSQNLPILTSMYKPYSTSDQNGSKTAQFGVANICKAYIRKYLPPLKPTLAKCQLKEKKENM